MVRLDMEAVETITFEMARKLMSYNEPIPDFSSCDRGKLQSCLDTPFTTFGGKDLYPFLIDKASILFYLMIKNHPFENGNKRIAVTTLFTFLHVNKKWMQIDLQKLYEFTKWVAASFPETKDGTVKAIKEVLKRNMVNL